MDKLFIDNKEIEMGGEVNIYLTYRSNVMGDPSKIYGNNSSTIKIPHTLGNARIIEQAQIVTSNTRFPYIKHSADVERDGITIIRNATVILLKTTPEDYDISLVWGVSEGLRQMSEDNEKLTALAGNMDLDTPIWTFQSSGTFEFPEAIYGFVRRQNNGKYWYHPVVTIQSVLQAIQARYSATFNVPEDMAREFETIVMPILGSATPKQTIRFIKYAGNDTSSNIDWDYYDNTTFNRGNQITKDDVKLSHMDAHIIVSGYTTTVIGETQRLIQDAYYISVERKRTTITNGEETEDIMEIAEIPCTKITQQQGIQSAYFDLEFKVTLTEDLETLSATDAILFNFRQRPVQGTPSDTYLPFVVTRYAESQVNLVMHQEQVLLGEAYHIAHNLPELEVMKWLKGIMQMFGIFSYQTDDTTINLIDYPTFFARKAQAQDWSDCLCMTATDASEEQEFTPEDFYQKNLVTYKNDDANKGMDSFFLVDNETLEAEGDYITLPFDSLATIDNDERPGIAKIPMYKQTNEDSDEWNPTTEREDDTAKKIFVLRNKQSSYGYYLSREGLDWTSLLNTYYQGIIQSVQQAKYITATFYFSADRLHRIDMGTPVYLSQYASYFAIIEIKTKKNSLAEVKLLKLV